MTAPHPSSSTISKFPLVIMQNISIITSFSTSKPVIFALSASAQPFETAEWHILHNQSILRDGSYSIRPSHCLVFRKLWLSWWSRWDDICAFGSLAIGSKRCKHLNGPPLIARLPTRAARPFNNHFHFAPQPVIIRKE
jgi:hypothetical protein